VGKVIQIRNVPDEVHDVLVRQAAAAGLSLSDYARRELQLAALRDANAEQLRRLALLPPGPQLGADAVRAERDRREQELLERVRRP